MCQESVGFAGWKVCLIVTGVNPLAVPQMGTKLSMCHLVRACSFIGTRNLISLINSRNLSANINI